MTRNHPLRFLAAAVAIATLAGCASKPPATVEDGSGAGTAGAGMGKTYASELDNPSSPLYNKVVYFEFDRAEVLPEYRDMLAAHAKFLASNPNQRVTLEGHADERGTREYNIGLGERRAKSVRDFMGLRGAPGSQSETVSYGEERPMMDGHDESAWSKNRRVELVYPR